MSNANYFDLNGLMKPYGENSILYTSENYLLRKKANLKMEYIEHQSELAIRHVMNDNYDDITFGDEKNTWSHDNHTGFVCLSANMSREYHKKFFYRQWWRRAHPKDWIFYLWVSGGVAGLLSFFFLWIPAISMVLSCLQDHKKDEFGRDQLKTDGKILAWLRVNSFSMPVTKWLCNLAIRRNKEFSSWRNVFRIYFGDNHPNAVFIEDIYVK